MSAYTKQYLSPVKNPSAVNGFSLAYALSHPRKTPHKLPKGWRWLRVGEYSECGDVCCDSRIAPVQILTSGSIMTEKHHPVRTKRPLRNPVKAGESGYTTKSNNQ